MVERHPYKVDVAGSTPVLPTIFNKLTRHKRVFLCLQFGYGWFYGSTQFDSEFFLIVQIHFRAFRVARKVYGAREHHQ